MALMSHRDMQLLFQLLHAWHKIHLARVFALRMMEISVYYFFHHVFHRGMELVIWEMCSFPVSC